MTLDPAKLLTTRLPLGTTWLLAECMEARGKQDLWTRQRPELLAALREQAIVRSVESSNRMEGVTVPSARLRPIALLKARPRDRSEEELSGYRRALDWVFRRKGAFEVTPDVIRKLHELAQGGSSGDAGVFKRRDNEIVEFLANGERRVRFVPTPAGRTPQAVEVLCRNYLHASKDDQIPRLLLISTFVFDLLCIHPFRDGNGRVSRLLTTLLLHASGFEVARYVSLERLVEERKEDYYRVLEQCSVGWHEGENEILPWWNYFLGIVRSGYKELQQQVAEAPGSPKGQLVRDAVLAQVGEFTLGDISAQIRGVSTQWIRAVLTGMKSEGLLRLSGRGRGARWLKIQSTPAGPRGRTGRR